MALVRSRTESLPSAGWNYTELGPVFCLFQNALFLEPEAREGGTDLRA